MWLDLSYLPRVDFGRRGWLADGRWAANSSWCVEKGGVSSGETNDTAVHGQLGVDDGIRGVGGRMRRGRVVAD